MVLGNRANMIIQEQSAESRITGQLELSHFFLNIFSLELLWFVLWSKLKIKGKTLNFWHCSHADSSLVVPGEMFCFPSVK